MRTYTTTARDNPPDLTHNGDNMRTRNGYPTKTEIIRLLDKHSLTACSLDHGTYPRYGIAYSDCRGANERAALVVADIRAAGFFVEHRLADTTKALNGVIRITPK